LPAAEGAAVGEAAPLDGIHTNQRSLHIPMRTNIEIDDDLMREAMKASGEPTKRATVERALRLLIQTRAQAGVRALRGKFSWSGDLSGMRLGRISGGGSSEW